MPSQLTESSLQPTTSFNEPSIANGSSLHEPSVANGSSLHEPSIANGTPRKRKLYCLTVCGYRKPGMSEEDYGEYFRTKHTQVVKGMMAKYGVLRWTHSHNTTETRKEMAKLYDEQFANIADYDCFSQSVFESVDSLVRMKEDPFYEEFVKDDHNSFADTKRTKITIGMFEEYIVDGKAV